MHLFGRSILARGYTLRVMLKQTFWLAGLALLTVACERPPQALPEAPAAAVDPPTRVTALGRLEPGEGVVDIGVPAGDRLAHLAVVEGQAVVAGQVLATLESLDTRDAERRAQQARIDEARQRLRRSQDIRPIAVAARNADVRRLEAELELARSDLRRTRALVDDDVLPPRELDYQASVEAQVRETLAHARTTLDQEQRDRDLAIAEARAALRTAEAELATAEARHGRTEIRSPLDGSVLDILLFAGESTQNGPLLRLGEVQRMYAVAEMHETDARFVAVGHRATIHSPALPQTLNGTVESISRLVHKNDVLDVDPAADTDSRVIEARILLAEPEVAARFVHLQVDIEIHLGEAARETTGE